MAKVNEKVAFITGGASGIGKATAQTFSRLGCKIVISDVNIKLGEEVAKNILDSGGEALFLKTDVTKAKEVEAAIHGTIDQYGRLDYAFNNAGIVGDYAKIIDSTEENWDRLYSIHLKGVWLCMKYELPQMIKQGHGVIVNMSSISGISVMGTTIPAYSAFKAGIVNLTRLAAKTYHSNGVRVNAVCAGYIRTPLIDGFVIKSPPSIGEEIREVEKLGYMGEPEDVAEGVVWLCSDSARFVNGHVLVIDGGITL
jgi:NAD(P)-dependent dehydrogenase (short-subunit alcohol dehydrogenase family)